MELRFAGPLIVLLIFAVIHLSHISSLRYLVDYLCCGLVIA